MRPAFADPASDAKELGDLAKSFLPLAKDPVAAQAQFNTFLAGHSDRDADFLVGAYTAWTQFQLYHLKDSKSALSTIEGARTKFATSAKRPEMDVIWAAILLDQNRAGEVETFYAAQWAGLLENHSSVPIAALSYGKSLEAQNKNDKALSLWRQTFQSEGLNIVETYPGDQIFNRLVESLLRNGRGEEALSWAKLNYMTCAFTDSSISAATKLLMRAWTANELTQTTAQAFVQAQQDPARPNPLAKVSLPVPDKAALQKQQENVHGWHSRRLEVNYHLLSNNWRQAMLEARSMIVDNPNSPEGVLEVCRVFKAADLNLKRANEFIAFMKNGTGDNPIIGFLKEHPEGEAGATDTAPAKTPDAN